MSADSAANAANAANAGNANTVGGQTVHKLSRTLTAGQSNVQIASIAGFNFFASCQSSNADLEVTAPSGVGWVMQAGGVSGNSTNQVTDSYDSGAAGDSGSIQVDLLSEGPGDATYGTATFYGATSGGTVLSGDLGYDYDTFDDTPPDTCIFAGHIISG